MCRFWHFALTFAVSIVPCTAQVSARHVEEPPKQLAGERFKSPMVLEFALAAADPMFWNGGEIRTKDNLSKYICDGVSFTDFSTEAKRGKDNVVTMTFRFELYDEPGVDKRVDVAVQAKRGDALLGDAGLVKNIKLGEKKHVKRSVEVRIAAEQLKNGDKPTLQITTVVRDDP